MTALVTGVIGGTDFSKLPVILLVILANMACGLRSADSTYGLDGKLNASIGGQGLLICIEMRFRVGNNQSQKFCWCLKACVM